MLREPLCIDTAAVTNSFDGSRVGLCCGVALYKCASFCLFLRVKILLRFALLQNHTVGLLSS